MVQKLLESYKILGRNMSIKLHKYFAYFSENLDDEKGE